MGTTVTRTITLWHCLRCGHTWTARKKGTPVRCAGCKSPYWNRSKAEKQIDDDILMHGKKEPQSNGQ